MAMNLEQHLPRIYQRSSPFYVIVKRVYCDSSNVVYFLDCVVCGFSYVGRTSLGLIIISRAIVGLGQGLQLGG